MSTSIHFAGGMGLTPAEGRVIAHLANGETAKVAARSLQVAPSTIKAHTDNARRRTGAKTVAHLVSLCWQHQALIAKQLCLVVLIASQGVCSIPWGPDFQQPPARLTRSIARTSRSGRSRSPFKYQ